MHIFLINTTLIMEAPTDLRHSNVSPYPIQMIFLLKNMIFSNILWTNCVILVKIIVNSYSTEQILKIFGPPYNVRHISLIYNVLMFNANKQKILM